MSVCISDSDARSVGKKISSGSAADRIVCGAAVWGFYCRGRSSSGRRRFSDSKPVKFNQYLGCENQPVCYAGRKMGTERRMGCHGRGIVRQRASFIDPSAEKIVKTLCSLLQNYYRIIEKSVYKA